MGIENSDNRKHGKCKFLNTNIIILYIYYIIYKLINFIFSMGKGNRQKKNWITEYGRGVLKKAMSYGEESYELRPGKLWVSFFN